ncbi:outer membrane protein [Pedobacter sp. UYEF25]
MKTASYIVALWLIAFAQLASAQEILSLQQAITIALHNNYDIKLIKNDLAIAQNNVSPGNAGMLPAVAGNFTTGGNRQNAVQTQQSGTEKVTNGAKSTNLSYGVGLDWTVFDGFRMFATYDKLKVLEQQGQAVAKAQILTTVSNVINAYYQMAKQQQLVIAADTSIDISKLRVSIAKNKLELGRGSKLDLLAAQVDYNTDTSTYLQQLNLLNTYMINLNQLMAREATIKFQVANEIVMELGLAYVDLQKATEKLNPDLQNAFLAKKVAELSLKELKGDRFPKISLNGGYDINRSSTPTGFNTGLRAKGFNYGLTASLNIFNGFLQNLNERNAKIEIESSSFSFEKTKQDVNSQLALAYQNYRTYLGLVAVEKNNVEIANENLDITLAKYRLGSIAPLELREAQRNAIDAKNRSLETQYQAKVAEVTLKQISGTINFE